MKNLYILNETYKPRKVAAEQKLKMKQCEQMEKKNQLSAAYEQLKLAAEEMRKYKQQAKQMKEELPQAEHSFKARWFFRRRTQDKWVKTCMLEREMAEQGR